MLGNDDKLFLVLEDDKIRYNWDSVLEALEDSDDSRVWGIATELMDSFPPMCWWLLAEKDESLKALIRGLITALPENKFNTFCSLVEAYGNVALISFFEKERKIESTFITSQQRAQKREKNLKRLAVSLGKFYRSSKVPSLRKNAQMVSFWQLITLPIVNQYLNIHDLASLLRTNMALYKWIYSTTTVSIPNQINAYLPFKILLNQHKKFCFAGLHGASSYDALSLYEGINMDQKNRNFALSQLGPGFYLAEGANENSLKAVEYFASERLGTLKRINVTSQTAIFQVLIKNFKHLMEHECKEVASHKWWQLQEDRSRVALYKAPISGLNYGSQLKINCLSREAVRVLPRFKRGNIDDLLYLGHLSNLFVQERIGELLEELKKPGVFFTVALIAFGMYFASLLYKNDRRSITIEKLDVEEIDVEEPEVLENPTTSHTMSILILERSLWKRLEDKYIEEHRRDHPKFQREYDKGHALVLYEENTTFCPSV